MRLDEALELDPARYPEATRYEVLGVLGAGAMGQVLLGRDTKLSREVAIKILAPEKIDRRNSARFYREAKTLAAIQHPSVMQILDFSGAECPTPFIVSERLTGCDLSAVIAARLLSEIEALAIAHEVASALAAAHALSVVHRDLKPSNIFVQPNGRVVLIDFGFAVGFEGETGNQRDTFAAHATAMMGTPDFASPEQVAGGSLAPQSDLFSLGSTLYFAATQVLPFRGESVFEVIKALGTEEPIPVGDLVDVSAGFAALLGELLQKDPASRPASAQVVQRRCAALLQAQKAAPLATLIAEISATRSLAAAKVGPLSEMRKVGSDAHATAPRAKRDNSLFARVKAQSRSAALATPVTSGLAATEVFTKPQSPTPAQALRAQQATRRYVAPKTRVVWQWLFAIFLLAAALVALLFMRR